jgi:platelet-activating factor acetylhydrolase IB subunit beta/gamma
LTKTKRLSDADLAALQALTKALVTVSPESRVLLTQLFDRKDVPSNIVADSNRDIEGIAEQLVEAGVSPSVACLSPPDTVRTEEHLEDHAHLNLEGYRLWMGELFLQVQRRLMPRAE